MNLSEILWLRFQENSEVDLMILDPGDEIYAYAGFWPTIPETIHVSKDANAIDIKLMRRYTVKSHTGCNSNRSYSYAGKAKYTLCGFQ